MNNRVYLRKVKRCIDIGTAAGALIILSPILIASAVAVRSTSSGPIFFRQLRVGENGRIFTIPKFRTMTHKPRKPNEEVFSGNSEVTCVGAILRRLKIDELPQLWNVLVGDMSIVGPRPCLPEQVDLLDENGRVRLKLKPGLTGLAQVNGNIYLSWPERWVYDRYYVEHANLWLDLSIICKTVLIVFLGEKRFARTPK